MRHRQIVEANIKDLRRINLLEAQAKYRRSKKNRPRGSIGASEGSNDSDKFSSGLSDKDEKP